MASSNSNLVKQTPLQRYMVEIRNFKLLTREEEKELAVRIQEHNDKNAAYKLVTSNLRLVVKIALQFQKLWMENLLDIIQEGNLGLMMAAKKFDPYKNAKFSYYAAFWIKAYILKFIMDNWSIVKLGTTMGQRKLFYNLKKEKQKLIRQGFDPSPKLLSAKMEVPEREVIEMEQRLGGSDISLEAPIKEDSRAKVIDFVQVENEPIEESMGQKELKSILDDKLPEFKASLKPRELELFEERIFSDTPITLQEFGDRYSITRERVRQIENRIIEKIRAFFIEALPDYDLYTARAA